MNIKVDVEFNNDFVNKLNKIGKDQEISLLVLFNNKFMKEYSEFTSFDEMIEKSNLGIDCKDIDNVKKVFESSEWNEYVKQHTKFGSWNEMQICATTEYIKNELGL